MEQSLYTANEGFENASTSRLKFASALSRYLYIPALHVAGHAAMTSKYGSRIWVRTSNVEHPVNSLAKLLLKHPFNRKLQILFPLPIDTVQAISTAILSGFYYKTQLNLSALVDVAFIQANLVDACLFCASADTNTRVAITPNGWLHLIVSKEQYQRVGLAGERIFGTGRAIFWSSQASCLPAC